MLRTILARVPSFLKSIRDSYFGSEEEDGDDQQLQSQTQTETAFEIASSVIDEPFDAETLCESMHTRRVASERDLGWMPAVKVPSPGLGLFSPAAERAAGDAEFGWGSVLYGRILGRKE